MKRSRSCKNVDCVLNEFAFPVRNVDSCEASHGGGVIDLYGGTSEANYCVKQRDLQQIVAAIQEADHAEVKGDHGETNEWVVKDVDSVEATDLMDVDFGVQAYALIGQSVVVEVWNAVHEHEIAQRLYEGVTGRAFD